MNKLRVLVFGMMLMLTGVASQAQLHIGSAKYGVPGPAGTVSGPSCDATASMSAACNGKPICQVYVDPRYLCGDPAQGKYKSLDVDYSCNGQPQPRLSHPDGSQALFRCSNPGNISVAPPTKPVVQPNGITQPNTGTPNTTQPDSLAGIPGRVWHVTEGDPSWRGVWTRRGNSNIFDVVNTRTYGNEVQRFSVSMDVRGNQVSINRAGQYYQGTLSADRRRADGSATWYQPGTAWHAVIE